VSNREGGGGQKLVEPTMSEDDHAALYNLSSERVASKLGKKKNLYMHLILRKVQPEVFIYGQIPNFQTDPLPNT
jgi:hypothetical protein